MSHQRSGNGSRVSGGTTSTATIVKIDDDATPRLEELQAEIRLDTGTDVTQRELLSQLIDDAYASREAVIDSVRTTVPLTEDEKAAMREGRFGDRSRRGRYRRDPVLMTAIFA